MPFQTIERPIVEICGLLLLAMRDADEQRFAAAWEHVSTFPSADMEEVDIEELLLQARIEADTYLVFELQNL